MPKPREIDGIARAATKGAKAEKTNGVTVEVASVYGPKFTPEMHDFAEAARAVVLSGVDRLGVCDVASIMLSMMVALMREEMTADETAFVFRRYADNQMRFAGDGADG